MLSLPAYALASGLRGFASDSLRVKVTRAEGPYVWVVTADLQDAGTPLTLNRSQVVFEEEMKSSSLQHKDGLVVFE